MGTDEKWPLKQFRNGISYITVQYAQVLEHRDHKCIMLTNNIP